MAAYRLATRGAGATVHSFLPPDLYRRIKLDGYRIPEDKKYTLDDVKAFAAQIESKTEEQELRSFLERTDRDLFEYFELVVNSLRTQKTLEFEETA